MARMSHDILWVLIIPRNNYPLIEWGKVGWNGSKETKNLTAALSALKGNRVAF